MEVVTINIVPTTPLAEFSSWWRQFDQREVTFAQDTDTQEALIAFDVRSLGTKVILDERGEVVHKSSGVAGYENLRRWVEEALAAG